MPGLRAAVKFRRRLPMYLGPGKEGPVGNPEAPSREEAPIAVDSWGVEIEPGDWIIEYDGQGLTISPVPEELEAL